MNKNYIVNLMIKVDKININSIDYFTGKTVGLDNFKDVLKLISDYHEKDGERIYKMNIVPRNKESIVLISNYKLIEQNFYKPEEYANEYKELLMIDKLKRR